MQAQMTIKKGWGFNVEQNFSRTAQDTPITLDLDAYANPGCVIGWIDGNPDHPLGFMRHGKIRVHIDKQALK